ncbi:MAG: GntR family transcriptional regulator [Saprospiraceae bacterium]|nr:GntR family transcriptional regulator [Saprospiraceae bacterium]
MAELGRKIYLEIARKVDFGFYLDGKNLGEILIPKRYTTPTQLIGDFMDVFVYLDGEERYVATTEEPFAQVGECAYLKVNKVENIGAFLNWGIMKELFVPFSEQRVKMEEGKSYVVYVYIDALTERITASMNLEKFLNLEIPKFEINQEVNLMIWTQSDIGYNAIINGESLGILYKNEVFKKLATGQKCLGYIKKLRDDNKIDLTLEKPGYGKIDHIAQNILDKISNAGGSLPYNDKTDPEVIYKIFGISKKVFKQSIGNLFKQRLIELSDSGIKRIDNTN